jgi:hypothetical protein
VLYRRNTASVSGKPSKRSSQKPISARIGWDPATFLAAHREVGSHAQSIVQLERPTTIISAESPVTFSRLGGGEIRARFSGPNELAMPPGKSLAHMFHPVAVRVGNAIEIQTAPQASYDFQLQIPARSELLKASLIEHQCIYQLSDKGRYAMGVQRLLGDLEILRRPLTIPVIRALTIHRIDHDLQALRRRFSDATPDQLDEIARSLQDVRLVDRSLLAIAGRVKASPKEIGPVIEDLVIRGLVIRGLRVQCHTCGYGSFVTLSESRPSAVCPACLASAAFTRETEPTFHYRLNAMVDRASDNGVLVHLLVWAQLLSRGADVWVLPGVDVKLRDQAAEADIVALLGSEIWVGEAKTRAVDFKGDEVHKDLSMALDIRAKHYVLACLEPIPDAILQVAMTHESAQEVFIWTLEGLDGNLIQRPVPPNRVRVE